MNNPAPVVEQETPEQSLLSDEVLKNLHDGKKNISELNEAQKYALHEHLMEQTNSSTETLESESAVPAVKTEEPAPKEEESASEETVKTAEESKTDYKALYKKEKDEENKWRQKLNSARERKKKSEQEFEAVKNKEVKIEADEDPYDEENFKNFVKESRTTQSKMKDEIDFLLKKLTSRDVDEERNAEENLNKTRDSSIYTSIHDLQGDYKVLQTTTPFKRMNSQWAGFLDTLVKASDLKVENINLTEEEKQNPAIVQQKMREKALGMYDNEPLFKDRTEKYFPASFKDKNEVDKYELILGLHEKTTNEGGSLRANYLEYLDEQGLLEETISVARREGEIKGSKQAAKAIENNSPVTLDPSDGRGTSPEAENEMTLERAKQIVPYITNKQDEGKPLTEADKKLQDAALKVIEESMGFRT